MPLPGNVTSPRSIWRSSRASRRRFDSPDCSSNEAGKWRGGYFHFMVTGTLRVIPATHNRVTP